MPIVSDAHATLELIEARRFIEVGVVELAVNNATGKDIQKMGKLIDDMTIALKQERPKDYSELDMAFHHQIAAASHNRFMLHMFVTIVGFMEQFMRETCPEVFSRCGGKKLNFLAALQFVLLME